MKYGVVRKSETRDEKKEIRTKHGMDNIKRRGRLLTSLNIEAATV
jgi:hypothetical protein